ncbi:MAG: hypothetical protein ACI8Y4_002015, partial [Candidatus Poriferisodalaceae bacterium]
GYRAVEETDAVATSSLEKFSSTFEVVGAEIGPHRTRSH